MNHGSLGASEFGNLTDSLSSSIRWRYDDYEGFLRKQIDILLGQPHDEPCAQIAVAARSSRSVAVAGHPC